MTTPAGTQVDDLQVIGIARPVAPTITISESGLVINRKNNVLQETETIIEAKCTDTSAPRATVKEMSISIFSAENQYITTKALTKYGSRWIVKLLPGDVDPRGGNTARITAIGVNTFEGDETVLKNVPIAIKNV